MRIAKKPKQNKQKVTKVHYSKKKRKEKKDTDVDMRRERKESAMICVDKNEMMSVSTFAEEMTL